jgi:SAM-dependent methyltransferase
MAEVNRWLLGRIRSGSRWALDLGGGTGRLGPELRRLGYHYANVDPSAISMGAVKGVGEQLPFRDDSFKVVVSEDSLEHLPDPSIAVREVRRVITHDGTFVIWVPFLHPFHGDDLWRFTPLGLRKLLGEAGLRIDTLEAPLGAASVAAQILAEALRRVGLARAERPIEKAGAWIDKRIAPRLGGDGLAFAEAFLVVAVPV